ncbi:hypothetical protein [Haloarchaeobius salinus]|uniref:hypothetical protein n=1 Tax=Haloarchaeobius salinus TaxID=1198298 RepID=UPI00210BBBC2|nr:hypothetical protein [Haloarchaeobius salinus]
MTDPDSERPRLNAYGKLAVACVLGSVGSLVLGAPASLSAGLFGLAALVMAVAMGKNARSKERPASDDDSGTDETEMKAKAMVGGEAGHG